MVRKSAPDALWHLPDLDTDNEVDWGDLPDIAPYYHLPKPTSADGDLDEDGD